ncbi:MAG: ATP-grasp domain-containing protein [Acidobacteriota bacterium]
MPYLILDPVGIYPSHLLRFLGGTLGRAGVAVFTSPGRFMIWRDKWSRELGSYIVDAFVATEAPSAAHLAAEIRRRHPQLEGVIPWDEETVRLGARLGELLGLDWNSVEVIERCRDKAVMKAWLRQRGGARVNRSATVGDGQAARDFQRRVGTWPIVVKPTAGSGSEDVYFPASDAELLRDCQRVLRGGRGEVLLEEYIGGEELVINGIVDAGSDLLITDVWHYDRRTSHGVPNLFYQTSKISTRARTFSQVGGYAAAVVEALELRRCPIHMEVKIDDRGPCLIEVGARLPGGNLSVLASKLHGRSLIELAACHYLADLPLSGRDLDYRRYDRLQAKVLHGIQAEEVAPIRRVHGVEEVEALPSFDAFGKVRPVGTRAPVTRDLDTAAWELYLIHPDARQIHRDAGLAHRLLRYE